ncbi:hypothetical protein F4808DRAFT_378357 [Astrocystis sublimbata]|nr:hypothetical protein F4808DRAFT_378357 [Astrocystis sublimbata]
MLVVELSSAGTPTLRWMMTCYSAAGRVVVVVRLALVHAYPVKLRAWCGLPRSFQRLISRGVCLIIVQGYFVK